MGLLTKALKKNEEVDVYQLKYLKSERLEHGYDNKYAYLTKNLDYPKFKRPQGMTEEQMYKVLSYMYVVIKSTMLNKIYNHITVECEVKSEAVLNKMVEALELYGFEVLGYTEDKSKSLYIIEGDKKQNKKKIKDEMFETKWKRNFTLEEVATLYGNLGLTLPEIGAIDKVASV